MEITGLGLSRLVTNVYYYYLLALLLLEKGC